MRTRVNKNKFILLSIVFILSAIDGFILTKIALDENKEDEIKTVYIKEDSEDIDSLIEIEEPRLGIKEDDGIQTLVNLPTITSIDNGKPNESCPNGECGMGKLYNDVDITSPTTFENTVINRCIDTDDFAGGQCWDILDLVMQQMYHKRLSTGGTGKVKDSFILAKDFNCQESECEIITNKEDLEDGDLVFFDSGYYGHGGIARGNYNNGYIVLLGQNQGGNKCDGGGSSTNLINMNLKDFIGAFRLRKWKINKVKSPDSGIVK